MMSLKKKRPPIESDDLWKLLHDGSDHIKEALRPKEDNYTLGLADFAELDALLRPHLLAWCRLVFPMGYRSFRGDYWVVPQGYIKIHIPTGATWHLGVITRQKKPELFLRGISPLHYWMGHVHEDYRTAYRSLKAWAIAQQSVPIEEETPFHGNTDYVVQLFWWVMFSGFMLRGKELPDTLPRYKGTAAIEEGDILFTAYPFPDFKHSLENVTYEGVALMEFHLSELESILERDPDNEELKDFIDHRHCHFFRWYVFDQYKKALSIDTSKLDGEEFLQYEAVMDVCREILNVIDTVRDPERCREILLSRFACIHRMKLPGSA